MNEEKTIGNKIRKLRKQKGLSQLELAKKVEITYSHLSDLENEKSLPSVTTIRKLARALDVHPAYFFSEENEDLFLQVVNNDAKLTPTQKKILLDLYNTFISKNRPT